MYDKWYEARWGEHLLLKTTCLTLAQREARHDGHEVYECRLADNGTVYRTLIQEDKHEARNSSLLSRRRG